MSLIDSPSDPGGARAVGRCRRNGRQAMAGQISIRRSVKGAGRNMVSKLLLGLAMLREHIPVGRNPMELVRVKGSTKPQKAIVILTPTEFKGSS
jgi:hypothetical protein